MAIYIIAAALTLWFQHKSVEHTIRSFSITVLSENTFLIDICHSLGWIDQSQFECILTLVGIGVQRIQTGENILNALDLCIVSEEAIEDAWFGQSLLHLFGACQMIVDRWAFNGFGYFDQIACVPLLFARIMAGFVASTEIYHTDLKPITVVVAKIETKQSTLNEENVNEDAVRLT